MNFRGGEKDFRREKGGSCSCPGTTEPRGPSGSIGKMSSIHDPTSSSCRENVRKIEKRNLRQAQEEGEHNSFNQNRQQREEPRR